ncbi:hypothetical protein [Propionivibrio sp.]|uniref:hypothetical protein n=1 Tax=Propionivibrio sp. TaxID=2212460 RepID=UPI003BF23FB0
MLIPTFVLIAFPAGLKLEIDYSNHLLQIAVIKQWGYTAPRDLLRGTFSLLTSRLPSHRRQTAWSLAWSASSQDCLGPQVFQAAPRSKVLMMFC